MNVRVSVNTTLAMMIQGYVFGEDPHKVYEEKYLDDCGKACFRLTKIDLPCMSGEPFLSNIIFIIILFMFRPHSGSDREPEY